MRVISIGTDRKLFEEKSDVLARNIGYASKMDELHIIIFSLKKLGLEPKSIENLHIYTTNSSSRWCYVFDAIKLGKKIIENWKTKPRSELCSTTGVENSKSTVISCQDPFETGLVGYFLKKKYNFPLQLQVHTDFLSPYFRNSLLNKIRVRIAKFLIPRADGLRVVSKVIGNSIKKYFPNLKTVPEILPIFIDVEKTINFQETKEQLNFSQFRFVILMASRLTYEKRIDLALYSLKKIIKEFPQTGLIVAGEGSERDSLEKKAKKLELFNNIIFVGWQDNLVPYYKNANIFLLTSEYEGYGLTLIEAGICGCPIVTTAVGLAKTDLFKNGVNSFVCPVGNVQCISNAVLQLIRNNSKRELFKQEMQDSIKSMVITREEYTAKYVDLLEKLFQKRNDKKNC